MIVESFSDLCIVNADISALKTSIQPRTNQINGKDYYVFAFDIVILFGLTEIKAQIAWMENVSHTFLPLRSMFNAE
jgi:hypothetical protein